MNDTDPLPQNEQLADEIFKEGVPAYEAARPAKREFLPWHRPRKQFVRAKQWADQIARLADDLQGQLHKIRYLGLPGLDLLDLRYIHNAVCVPRSLELSFLGFNSGISSNEGTEVELNISLDEIKKLPRIDPLSEVIPDDIFKVANERSIAFKRAQTFGPYEVINLDFCDGFGSYEPLDEPFNAIMRLLQIQLRNSHPWLLLLTTRVGRVHVHAATLERLVHTYVENLTNCAEFSEASAAKFAIGTEAELNAAIGTDEGHLRVFVTALCKWLLGISAGNNPPSSIEVKSVIGYKVTQNAPCEDLLSLAIRFEPHLGSLNDPAGLGDGRTLTLNEGALATKALKRIAKRVDADAVLAGDAALRQAMAEEMATLLEVARYSRPEYLEWVRVKENWTP